MSKDFFPGRTEAQPVVYAYSEKNPLTAGLLKIGYTAVNAKARVAQQYPTKGPNGIRYDIVVDESAMRDDGSVFSDRDIHRVLRDRGFSNPDGEWFACSPEDVRAAIVSVRNRMDLGKTRDQDFGLRPEQSAAIEKTMDYFSSFRNDPINKKKTPHFLWNAKMRFGKTFTSYQLALAMGWTKILILTFKPAVQNAWEEDLERHIDFQGWQFIHPGGLSFEDADPKMPIVCFGSFQDYLGKNTITGSIKAKNEWVHATNWDCVILDEYHYGAWRENAKELFEAEDRNEAAFGEGVGIDFFEEAIMPITTSHYLYLSGTPFRAIASGEFIEEQIFNWTYTDEQRAKLAWSGANNPYAQLPRMVLMTYQLPEAIRDIASKGEFDEFDLNVFFSAEGEGDQATFRYEDEVQKWLDHIRGSFIDTAVDSLKLGVLKPPMPFSDVRLIEALAHTYWFLPSVASCHAMSNLLKRNKYYNQNYEVIVAAGTRAGIGAAALPPVQRAMGNPLETKTITLSCGKLTTGVTVKPWTGIFMLRNCSSPETYFQAAFRVQSPWTLRNPDGTSPNKEVLLKEECYVFDFAPDRALRQVADYGCRLNVDETSPEAKVADFISFLPVLAFDGSSMKQIDAAGVLEMAMSGTTATLLARRWESALLVNVTDDVLEKVLQSDAAMEALKKIEGFRNLNQDIETLINKSDSVKAAKKESNDRDLTKKEQKILSDDEKDVKNRRKEIQKKLIKFATRIPVFMYLTDDRERTLKEVITQLEPGLFRKVTGLDIQDFELLVELTVFNSGLMNDAIYKFKRYEDSSLTYTGIDMHEDEDKIGLFDTVLSKAEAKTIFENIPA